MGEETTGEIELNMAGLAIFPREWAGVFAADETPPRRGYCAQNTAPRASALEVALRDGPTWETVAAAVPRVDARFHLGGKSSAGGRRGPGEVSARTEMKRRSIFAVRSSDRLNGLRTARMDR